MTAKERVLNSRLILKVDRNETYARKVSLRYFVFMADANKDNAFIQAKK